MCVAWGIPQLGLFSDLLWRVCLQIVPSCIKAAAARE